MIGGLLSQAPAGWRSWRQLGLFVGGVAMPSAKAADLGGDCCADLEERVAELEATTARKGNRKMSLTISGQVNRSITVVGRRQELEHLLRPRQHQLVEPVRLPRQRQGHPQGEDGLRDHAMKSRPAAPPPRSTSSTRTASLRPSFPRLAPRRSTPATRTPTAATCGAWQAGSSMRTSAVSRLAGMTCPASIR